MWAQPEALSDRGRGQAMPREDLLAERACFRGYLARCVTKQSLCLAMLSRWDKAMRSGWVANSCDAPYVQLAGLPGAAALFRQMGKAICTTLIRGLQFPTPHKEDKHSVPVELMAVNSRRDSAEPPALFRAMLVFKPACLSRDQTRYPGSENIPHRKVPL